MREFRAAGWTDDRGEFKDEMQNLELLMNYIKSIYLQHTNFTEEELDNLLKKDIYLNASIKGITNIFELLKIIPKGCSHSLILFLKYIFKSPKYSSYLLYLSSKYTFFIT